MYACPSILYTELIYMLFSLDTFISIYMNLHSNNVTVSLKIISSLMYLSINVHLNATGFLR